MTATFAQELDAALTRYFFAEALGTAERARLIAASVAFVADRPALLGQVGMFAPDDPIGHGLAWWEARQGGAREMLLPISELDHALMMLTSEPVLDPRPSPRPHCPPELLGRWQLIGVSRDGDTVAPPPAPRAWLLGPDGELTTEGDDARAAWGWRVHEASFRSLCLGPAFDPLRERWTVLEDRPASGEADDELDLISPDVTRGFHRWRRSGRSSAPV